MMSDGVSVINVQTLSGNEETEEELTNDSKLALQDVGKALGISLFGIIAFSVIFFMPWTTIPRTDSVIYQSYWMEALLPMAVNKLLSAGQILFKLAVYTKEQTLMKMAIFFKIYFLWLIPYAVLYVLSYLIWSGYLKFNHPLPTLGLICILISFALMIIGLWRFLPSHLLAKEEFRRRLKLFMLICVWVEMMAILNEFLALLFVKSPVGLQFLVPLMVAGCRELYKILQLKTVTKMMVEIDEAASALIAINTSTHFSFFISMRMVGAEFSTICSTVIIDFALHLKATIDIIKEFRKVNEAGNVNVNQEIKTKITTLIIAELIEGFMPLIYGTCILMAYYGPNSHLLSNIGRTHWGEEIKDIRLLFLTMSTLFAIDTLSVLINSICLWKAIKVNMLSEFSSVLSKYWYFMAFILAHHMNSYIASTDINFGGDQAGSFQWISNDGWINLVNTSTILTHEEKLELMANAMKSGVPVVFH